MDRALKQTLLTIEQKVNGSKPRMRMATIVAVPFPSFPLPSNYRWVEIDGEWSLICNGTHHLLTKPERQEERYSYHQVFFLECDCQDMRSPVTVGK